MLNQITKFDIAMFTEKYKKKVFFYGWIPSHGKIYQLKKIKQLMHKY